MEQLTGNEVSYTYAKQIIDEITHTGNVRTLDDMLSCVYQKIILKLGQMQPITIQKDEKSPRSSYLLDRPVLVRLQQLPNYRPN